jgi:serine protease
MKGIMIKSTHKIATTLIMSCLWLVSFLANAQSPAYISGELLIQLDAHTGAEDVADKLVATFPEGSISIQRNVSDHMRIWLFAFDESRLQTEVLLRHVKEMQGVQNAQLNHILSERNTPDDPFFSSQWHHVEAGDHDIDSDLAWDITTGGTTSTNDRIVVCVVETNGSNWDLPDLIDNHWINQNEIADNGIDDDDNGYIDDVDGWNVQDESDDIPEGNHGTQVSSMIGATGNNGTGITGVNWDVELMQVRMGSINEANVIAAYTYPLVMRKKYNESNGEQGAFVVATNSSWGIDFGQAADAPLWCAMYDSLGTYGVLSCAATANNEINVDVSGDLPTSCPSNFLISVTATDNSDIRDFSGYGVTNIDIAAPGDQVYLANNNGYGNSSGTSFATPCVAGAVALLYSAPCTSLMIQAYTDPEGTALLVRDYILEGVDPVSNLSNEVASGGRLNVNNSLLLVMDECQEGGCISPFAITATQEEGTLNYLIEWMETEDMVYFNLRYRIVGNPDWIELNEVTANPITLNNLSLCSIYEVQIQANCGKGQSEWSDSFEFTTDGCCQNPDPSSLELTYNENGDANITWEQVFIADGYTVLVQWPGDNLNINTILPEVAFPVLPCTEYTVTITTDCEDPLNAPSNIVFITSGCGSCQDLTYCEVSGNSNLEFIERVKLNTIDNLSGSDNGYGDYTDQSTSLNPGGTYTIELTPGFANFGFSEQFKVWIDYNSDGEFNSDNEELVFSSPSNITALVLHEFTVPSDVSLGSHVRMRVAMSYGGDSTPTEACGDLNDGEAEDYCITFLPVGVEESNYTEPAIYPNPSSGLINIENFGSEYSSFNLFDVSGRIVYSSVLQPNQNVLDISNLLPGIYTWHIGLGRGKLIKK